MKIVIFRVDSSTKMGAGHLMRCLTLANEFKQKNHKVVFVCRDLAGNLMDLLSHHEFEVKILKANKSFKSDNFYLNWLGATQEKDAEQTIQNIPQNADLLIVDNYGLDKNWHKKLRPLVGKIMVIDDLADRKFDCDILLNQNLGSQKESYKDKVPNDCKLLLGCDYALLRPEFSRLREKALEKRQKTKEIKNILVSMGGSDVENITYEILQNLDSRFNISVVLGNKSPHNKMIASYADDKKNINIIIDADNMAQLMLDADLAIGAGGSTSWERCCLGLPTLLYVTADNQILIAKNLEAMKAIMVVKNIKNELQLVLNNFDLWQIMSKNSKNICDGLGAKRIKI